MQQKCLKKRGWQVNQSLCLNLCFVNWNDCGYTHRKLPYKIRMRTVKVMMESNEIKYKARGDVE